MEHSDTDTKTIQVRMDYNRFRVPFQKLQNRFESDGEFVYANNIVFANNQQVTDLIHRQGFDFNYAVAFAILMGMVTGKKNSSLMYELDASLANLFSILSVDFIGECVSEAIPAIFSDNNFLYSKVNVYHNESNSQISTFSAYMTGKCLTVKVTARELNFTQSMYLSWAFNELAKYIADMVGMNYGGSLIYLERLVTTKEIALKFFEKGYVHRLDENLGKTLYLTPNEFRILLKFFINPQIDEHKFQALTRDLPKFWKFGTIFIRTALGIYIDEKSQMKKYGDLFPLYFKRELIKVMERYGYEVKSAYKFVEETPKDKEIEWV